jgi:hypothetical protein
VNIETNESDDLPKGKIHFDFSTLKMEAACFSESVITPTRLQTQLSRRPYSS